MSRSRRPQCTNGRTCSCCGDAGGNRRKREQEWAKSDGITVPRTRHLKATDNPFHHDSYYEGKAHRRMR